MSNENWTATDCGKYIRVRAPNGGTCEMWGDADDAHERFAYFVLRQMIRDLAAVTEDRDAYRVSSEIRGANIEAGCEEEGGVIYPKSKVTVSSLTVATEITEEDEGDPRIMEVSLHDDEAPGLIAIRDKNKDDSGIAFFVEQWPSIRSAVDQLAGCARTHEVMGKPRESSDGGEEMALAQAAAMIERLNRERSQIRHGLQGLVDYLGEAERANAHQAPQAAAVVALRHAFNCAATILKAMHESEARSAK